MQPWLEADARDGFPAVPTHFPTGVEDFTVRVAPVLQQHGLFRTESDSATLRDDLGSRPLQGRWGAGAPGPAGRSRAPLTMRPRR